jgi:hypothetical protein
MITSFATLTSSIVKWLKDPKLADIAPDLVHLAESHFRRVIKHHDREGTITFNALDVPPATLVDLTLSANAFIVNQLASFAIIGKTPGSVVTATSSDMTTLTVDGAVVSGTFTTLGSPTITLTETLDGASNTPHVSGPLNISVVNPLDISGSPPAGTVGSPYAFTPTVTGGSGSRTFQLTGSLLAGLSFDVTTGAITGTPTVSGLMNLTITVSDLIDTDSQAFTINVADASSIYYYAAILEDEF